MNFENALNIRTAKGKTNWAATIALALLLAFGGAASAKSLPHDQDASVAVGQANKTSNSANQGAAAAANTLSDPREIYVSGSNIFAADSGNSRVLLYTSIPAADNAGANIVIGQPDMTTVASGTTAAKMATPMGVFTDGSNVTVADAGNNRVLLYNSIPAADGAAADVALCQPDMVSNAANNTGLNEASCYAPQAAIISGTKLIVSDSGNNRVLIWDPIPAADGASATVVIGQEDFVSNSPNQGAGPMEDTLYDPAGLMVYGGKLYVADRGNNRILIYNPIPATDGASATIVLGQTNFVSNSVNQGIGFSTGNTLSGPTAMNMYSGRLYISDTGNNRAIIYQYIPTTNGAYANVVIGQTTFYVYPPNQGVGPQEYTLYGPSGVFFTNNQLYVSDSSNNRLMIYDPTFHDSGQNLGGSNTSCLALGDVEGDGDIDFVAGNDSNQSNNVWLNDGSANFAAGQAIGAENTRTIHLADLDGDGDLDLVAGNNGAGDPNTVWMNDGSANFANSGQALGTGQTIAGDVGDVDSDGDIDFIEGNWGQGDVVWINDGTGILTDSGQSLGTTNTMAILLADVDRDGDPDIIEGNYSSQGDIIWQNDSTGIFYDSGQSLGALSTTAIEVLDFNGDGDLDIAMGIAQPTISRGWSNNGLGVFSITAYYSDANHTQSIETADLDGDGDYDMIFGNETGGASNVNSIWFNNGAGSFLNAGYQFGAQSTMDIKADDLDGDGDVDYISGNNGGQANTIWINDVDHFNSAPNAPTLTAEPDALSGPLTLVWSAGSDAQTADTDLLSYDLRIGTTSGGCDIYCGFFPASGATPFKSRDYGNVGKKYYYNLDLHPGTYYWTVRTVDSTYKRGAWAAEDSFSLTQEAAECGVTFTESSVLTEDLYVGYDSSPCLRFGDNDITLDCQGHKIVGNGQTSGILAINQSNITIQNCELSHFQNAIDIRYSDSVTIQNNTLKGNYKSGVFLYQTDNSSISNNVSSANLENGILLQYSDGNTVSGNTLKANKLHGVFAVGSASNIVNSNVACYSGVDDINSTTTTTTGDLNTCDETSRFNDTGETVCTNACAALPANNISACGETIRANSVLTFDLPPLTQKEVKAGTFECIVIAADNVTLDCQGNRLMGSAFVDETGTGSPSTSNKYGIGVYMDDRSGVTVKNCDISYFSLGISVPNGNKSVSILDNTIHTNDNYGVYIVGEGYYGRDDSHTIDGNTVDRNGAAGIFLHGGQNIAVNENTLDNNRQRGIQLESYSNNNTISNNIATSNQFGIALDARGSDNNTVEGNAANSNDHGIYLTEASNNSILNNNANGNSYYGIYITSGSDNNTLDGNFADNNGWAAIGIANSDGNRMDNNGACDSTTYSDIRVLSGAANTGDNNACDSTTNYNDDSGPGCVSPCGTQQACGISVGVDTTLADDYLQSGTETCITITADNVTLDCAGHSLLGNGKNGYGIFLDTRTNVTVQNCNVSQFNYGIYEHSSVGSTFTANTLSYNNVGLYIDPSFNNVVVGNDIFMNDLYGVLIEDSHVNSIVSNNIYSNGAGVAFMNSTDNSVQTNKIFGNDACAVTQDAKSDGNLLLQNYMVANNKDGSATDCLDNRQLVEEIPTLQEWGVILLTAALAALGCFWLMRRRKAFA